MTIRRALSAMSPLSRSDPEILLTLEITPPDYLVIIQNHFGSHHKVEMSEPVTSSLQC